MGLSEQINILVRWLQSLALLFQQGDVKIPPWLDQVRLWLNALLTLEIDKNLNLPSFLTSLKNYRIEFRVQFLALAIIFPLIITVLTLLVFKPLYVVLWYLIFLSSLVVIFVGTLGYLAGTSNIVYAYLNSLSETNQGLASLGFSIGETYFAPQLVLILIGCVVAVICVILALLFLCIKCIRDRRHRSRAIADLTETLEQKKPSLTREETELMHIANTPLQDKNHSFKRKDTHHRWKSLFRVNSESQKKKQVEKFLKLKEMKNAKESVAKFDWCRFIFNSVVFAIMFTASLFLTQIVNITQWQSFYSAVRSSFLAQFFDVFKWILFAFSIILLLFILFTIPECGRVVWFKIKYQVYLNSLIIIFLLLSVLHVPLVSILFSSFSCDNVVCSTGYQFPIKYSTMSTAAFQVSYNNSKSGICEQCVYFSNSTMDRCNITNVLCPGVTSLRLVNDYGLSCLSDIAPFFWGPAILIGIIYGIGLPLLFCLLTYKNVQALQTMQVDPLLDWYYPKQLRDWGREQAWLRKKQTILKISKTICCLCIRLAKKNAVAPIDESPKTEEKKKEEEIDPFALPLLLPDNIKWDETCKKPPKKWSENILNVERWRIRTAVSLNPVKSIFYTFEYRWRFYAILNLLYRLCLSAVTILLIQYNYVSVPLVLATHFAVFILQIATRPYISFLEDAFASLSAFITVLTAVYTCVLIFLPLGINMPDAVTIIVLILNVCIPIVGICLSLVTTITRTSEQAEYSQRLECLVEHQKYWKQANLESRFKGETKDDPKKFRLININQIPAEKIQENWDLVDHTSTMQSLNLTVNFFLVLGVCCFVGLAVCALGLFYDELRPRYQTSIYTGSASSFFNSTATAITSHHIANNQSGYSSSIDRCLSSLLDYEYVGYKNWTHFTQNCCCNQGKQYTGTTNEIIYPVTEMWQCANGQMKERIRVFFDSQAGRNYSSLAFRSLCGSAFAPGIQPMPFHSLQLAKGKSIECMALLATNQGTLLQNYLARNSEYTWW